jgi:hypothetical protein
MIVAMDCECAFSEREKTCCIASTEAMLVSWPALASSAACTEKTSKKERRAVVVIGIFDMCDLITSPGSESYVEIGSTQRKATA